MKSRRHYAAAVLAAAGMLLTGGIVHAKDDVTIREAVEARLEKAGLGSEADLQVAVHDGEVTLSGVATSLPISREAEKLARKESKTVHNQVRVHIEEPVNDSEIIEEIRKAVLRDPRYDVFDYVEFAIQDGAVVLLGSVSQPWKKTSIESRVARVPGIRALRNDISVQSLSRFDADIRASLARQIYGNSRFVQYQNRAHPPIRILVDRGHVVLAGWVQNPVDKAMLGAIAMATPSFSVENRLRVDGEVPEEDRKKESADL
jgi:osmotically-inducible protein OsmY